MNARVRWSSEGAGDLGGGETCVGKETRKRKESGLGFKVLMGSQYKNNHKAF